LKRLFWKNFFQLLLVVVALAEWICASWLLIHVAGIAIPSDLHVLGPLGLYLINRLVVTRPIPAAGWLRTARRAYTSVAFTSLFGFLYLLITGLLWSVTWAGMHVVSIAAGTVPPIQSAADAARMLASGGLMCVTGAMAYGYLIGHKRVWVNRLEIPIATLAPSMDGLTIAQISDVHLGGFTTPSMIADYVQRINELGADLIVITGDITDGVDHAAETFPVLDGLRARLGVVAILGNHDVGTGTRAVLDALARHTQFTVLVDENLVVEDAGARLHVVGLLDRGLDWARGLRECPTFERLYRQVPAGEPAVVLSHRPDLFEHAARLGAPLVLAGHTHGGQLAIPWTRGRAATLARFMTRYPRGTFRIGDSWLHVNLGLGVTAQPVRVATPREITLVTLRSSATRH